MNKQDILNAIRETAKQNNGKPLGKGRFEKATGITSWEWGQHWARFGDAQKEAGFTPNQLQSAHADDFIIEKLIGLIRKLGTFPTLREIVVERHNDPELPSFQVFQRLGTKAELADKILDYCKDKSGFNDVSEVCQNVLRNVAKPENSDEPTTAQIIGEVYLCKSGRHFKIGKSTDFDRRISEIKMPHKAEEIHRIKTDDPSGVEAYWHKRFTEKRMNNSEWFDLNSADVKAFKRWKRII